MASSDISTRRAPAAAPVAKILPKTLRIHGHEIQDEYAWLREKSDPAVAEYIDAENRYAEAYLQHTRPLQETIYNEMVGRIKETDLTVPYRKGEYYYYTRTEAGKQYRIHCRKHRTLEAPEEIVLDLNSLADEGGYLSLGHFELSDDATMLAYTLDRTGFRQYTLHVLDLASGRTLPDTALKVTSLEWGTDGATIYYTVEDEAKRSYRLYRHTLGAATDDLLFEESDGMFRLGLDRALDNSYVYLYSISHTTSECRFHDAASPDADWTLISPRVQNRQYFVEHHSGRFFIRVNDTGVNYRLVSTPLDALSSDNWTELIAHREDVMLTSAQFFAGHYIVGERRDGLIGIRVTDIGSGEAHHIEFPEPVYEIYGINNVEWNTTCFRYNYESLVTPASVFDYDILQRRSTLLKQTEVLGGYDPELYRSERIHATASDGVRVPVSLLYRRDVRRDGSAPLHLQGYGAYGFAHPTGFSSARLSLLDRGFVMAIAHIRGGGELGKSWHDAGRMKNKINSFTDFIAVAEHLVAEGYTAPERMIAEGGSAGGLLMGAVVQRRPDLFAAALVQVPFVDVINTMLDTSLPLTIGEFEEWGNPAIADEFEYIRQYCPYTNLSRQAYPTMLVKTSFNDSQVMYWEPAKYVARLRTLKTDSNPLLLVTNMGAGHGGASGRYDRLRERALDFAFMLDRVGITD